MTERALGRLKSLREAGEQDSGSESGDESSTPGDEMPAGSDSSGEESGGDLKATGKKPRAPSKRYRWPWQLRCGDIYKVDNLHKNKYCKMPLVPSSRTNVPKFFSSLKRLTFNHCRVFLFAGPYALLQTSLFERHNGLLPELAAALYAIAYIPRKVQLNSHNKLAPGDRERFKNEKDLDQVQKMVDDSMVGLSLKTPTHYFATISKEQLHWFSLQVCSFDLLSCRNDILLCCFVTGADCWHSDRQREHGLRGL